jgi:hypothetical protein
MLCECTTGWSVIFDVTWRAVFGTVWCTGAALWTWQIYVCSAMTLRLLLSHRRSMKLNFYNPFMNTVYSVCMYVVIIVLLNCTLFLLGLFSSWSIEIWFVVIIASRFLLRVYKLIRMVTRGLGSVNLWCESNTDRDVYEFIVCFFLLYCVLIVEYIYIYIYIFHASVYNLRWQAY